MPARRASRFQCQVIPASIPIPPLSISLSVMPARCSKDPDNWMEREWNGMAGARGGERETIIRSEVHSRSFVGNQNRCQGNARQRNSSSPRRWFLVSLSPSGKRTPKLWIRVLLTTNSTPGDSGITFPLSSSRDTHTAPLVFPCNATVEFCQSAGRHFEIS